MAGRTRAPIITAMPTCKHPPAHLLAVEQLPGLTPGDKFRYLHGLTRLIRNGSPIEGVPEQMAPLFNVILAKNAHMGHYIAVALQYSDPSVTKQALKARWFFSHANPLMMPLYMVRNVFPSATLKVRAKVIKRIGIALCGYPRTAEDGFELFRKTYGLEQALPMFVACNQNYIFDIMTSERIILSPMMLNSLYPWHPDLVLRYLLLATRDDSDYKIPLAKYADFLPKIVKYYPLEFARLYQSLENPKIRLSNNKAKHFLKSAKSYLISEPRTFLKMLPLELVTKRLHKDEFHEMFRNLFPNNPAEFDITEVAAVMAYLPQSIKFHMLLAMYEKVYQKNLFENVKILFSPAVYNLFFTHTVKTAFLTITFTSINKTFALDKTPPHMLLKYVLERIKESENSNRDVIGKHIEPLIKSCALFNDQVVLYEALRLLNDRQRDDCKSCLKALELLAQEFDLSKLARKLWVVIAELLLWEDGHRSFIQAEDAKYGPVMRALLHHLLSLDPKHRSDEDKSTIDTFIELSIRCFLKYKMTSLFIDDVSDKRVAAERIDSFLDKVSEIYTPIDSLWSDTHQTLRLVLTLLKNMHEFNVKHGYTTKKSRKSGKAIPGALVYDLYPWFKTTAIDLLKQDPFNVDTRRMMLKLQDIIRMHDPQGYYEDIDIMHDVSSVDALHALQRDHLKIGFHWEVYADACSTYYPRSKHFLRRVKWYGRLGMRIFSYAKDRMYRANCCAMIAYITYDSEYHFLMDWWCDRVDESRKSKAIILKAASETYPPVSLKVFQKFMMKYPSLRPLIRQLLNKVTRKGNCKVLCQSILKFIEGEDYLKEEGARLMSIVGTVQEVVQYNYLRKREQEIAERGVKQHHLTAMEHNCVGRAKL